jgi:hypothetical protein
VITGSSSHKTCSNVNTDDTTHSQEGKGVLFIVRLSEESRKQVQDSLKVVKKARKGKWLEISVWLQDASRVRAWTRICMV